MRQTRLLCCSLPIGSEPQSLQVAVSPRWNQPFPGVISANLSSDAWTLATVVVRVHLPVSSSDTSAFPKVPWVGFPRYSVQRLPNGRVYRGCSHSLMFRPPSLLATHVVPTAEHRFRCAGQPWRLHLSRTCVVTFAGIRHASRPNSGN